MGSSCVSGSAEDREKPSDASHRRRRTRAMASPKVGDGLPYQAALRLGHGAPVCKAWATRVVQEQSPSRLGVVRAMARSGHWRWGLQAQVGPHFLKEPAPYLIRGDLQLPAQDKPFQDLGRVLRRVGAEQGLQVEGTLGASDKNPANEHRRLARAVPDRGLWGEFHRVGGDVGQALPVGGGFLLRQHRTEHEPLPSDSGYVGVR